MSVQKPPTPPKLVAENAIERGETEALTFTAEEWSRVEQHIKRRLAGAADTHESSGPSTLREIRSYIVVQRELSEYAND